MYRQCTPEDAAAICDIYNYYVRETVVTFEEIPVLEPDMAQRIADVMQRLPWFVWEEAGVVVGCVFHAKPGRCFT